MATVGVSGGDKFDKILSEIADQIGNGGLLKVGFFENATYPDGTHVAQVAFWAEYGTTREPIRAFFRQMIAAKSPEWGADLAKILQANGNDLPAALELMGEHIKDQLVQSIVEFSDPANAESTVAKKGFNDPLIDSGVMQRSADFEVSP